MKNIKTIFAISILILTVTFYSNTVFASDPPDPPIGGHGSDDDLPPGGDAPIGGGTFILVGLAVAYGGRKVFNQSKKPIIKNLK